MLCQFYKSTVGKKVVVAATGTVFILFVIGHMIGNIKTFMGLDAITGLHKLDMYARFLREMGHQLVGHETALWGVRIVLLACLVVHVWTVYQLRRISKKARPQKYVQTNFSSVTFASYSMWWGGLFLLLYIVFHILHLTTGQLHFEGFVEGAVYANVYYGFKVWYVTLFYVVAMGALAFHLYHGVWSLFQTLGLDNPDLNRPLRFSALGLAIVLFLGFVVVPLAVFTGCLPEPTALTLEV
ncbi:succinate dehydrogenase cytochrome b subunit [Oligoflexia bacterium]|nr:succinate dehydrogenase cytochrome b subunit [Oligoflexia bacterium]